MIARGEAPANGPGRRVERVQLRVERADVNGAVRADRRRGDHIAGHERVPQRVPVGAEVVDVEVERPPEARAVIGERGRGPERVAGGVRPQLGSVRPHRVGAPAGVAGVEDPAGPHRDVALPPAHALARDRRDRRPERPHDPRATVARGGRVVETLIARAEGQRHRPKPVVIARERAGGVDDPARLQVASAAAPPGRSRRSRCLPSRRRPSPSPPITGVEKTPRFVLKAQGRSPRYRATIGLRPVLRPSWRISGQGDDASSGTAKPPAGTARNSATARNAHQAQRLASERGLCVTPLTLMGRSRGPLPQRG